MPSISAQDAIPTLHTFEVLANQALTSELVGGLDRALDEAEAAKAILMLHIVGAAEWVAWPGNAAVHQVSKWERALRRIERSSVVTMFLASGPCSSLALELLLVADYRIAVADFSLRVAVPSAPAWPGMALYRLSHEIGHARTKRLILNPQALLAENIAEFDLLDHVAWDTNEARDHIDDMLAHAPLRDFAIRRRLIQDAAIINFDEALGAHLAACDRDLRRGKVAPATGLGSEGARQSDQVACR